MLFLTVAKNGPIKNPSRLIATDAAMMFGTLASCTSVWLEMWTPSYDRENEIFQKDLQPEDQVKSHSDDAVYEHHPPLTPPMGRFGK